MGAGVSGHGQPQIPPVPLFLEEMLVKGRAPTLQLQPSRGPRCL